ncbi:MAG: Undecaprenyl-diphosphatase [Candidatus Woesebacteria bacterium GW2011_GWA1_40_43]|uniref:Undecaprenyl-diphosphatase n=1 Tax=Candidatus Woesebacteria bacterium GW2011_GWA1_40_43 TaxID=1618553 RepID=A0A0G0SMS3_9BACT|nr:MAG: Undecaprenyl-diphosphatase [Candidatus Woesebacteria bacterium GW2011_GWA1_40_43]
MYTWYMSVLHVFILSLIEGLTEFLPISSTGHLILASKLLGISETNFVKTFEIVAFIPTAVVGFTLYPLIKDVLLGSSTVTLDALFWGGIALIGIELFLKKRNGSVRSNEIDYERITYKKAFLIGVFQCLSVIPGVSRAAATIIGGLATGLNRPMATEFSFLLAVPTMIAATALDVYKSREFISQTGFLTLFAGSVLSFIFAMLAVKFLINFVKKHSFIGFGIYRIVLAILFWIFVK